MLQQTQVATAIPYFERWLQRFPTVRDLAEAPLEDVLKQWQGLGYYARAHNLHKAAQRICELHGGTFPTTYEAVLALPGVGRYTAGAICSIALGLDTPLVDANVIRVLSRVFAIPGDPKSKETQEALWARAEAELPSGRAGEFNQALMELGALSCGSPPRCASCPVVSVCDAHRLGETGRFPELAAKPAFTKQVDVSAWVFDGERFLLRKRPADGLWGGLYELPRVTALPDESPAQAAERAVRELVGVPGKAGTTLATVRHGVTTRKITLYAVAVALQTEKIEHEGLVWATHADLTRYPLSSPQAKLLAQLEAGQTQLRLF